jgi:MFS family permease
VFFISYMALAAFSAGAAGAKNIQTLIILRFFAGSFGASPLTNSGGVIADMFSAKGNVPLTSTLTNPIMASIMFVWCH